MWLAELLLVERVEDTYLAAVVRSAADLEDWPRSLGSRRPELLELPSTVSPRSEALEADHALLGGWLLSKKVHFDGRPDGVRYHRNDELCKSNSVEGKL